MSDPIPLGDHLADIEMGRELFEASPDGRAWPAEQRARIEALPDGQITATFDDGHDS